MITLFIRGLPRSATEQSVTALFAQYGVVRAVDVVRDIFSGDCKGFATVNMEGHEGRAAISGLDGSEVSGSIIHVNLNRPRNARGGGRRR